MPTPVADLFEKPVAVSDPTQTQSIVPPSAPTPVQKPAAIGWRKPLSNKEIVLASIFLVAGCAALIALFSHYPYYPCCFGQLSNAIRHWNFKGLDPAEPKEFWGYPYLTALIATITRLPDDYAMVVISASMFVLANYLCSRLWGTTVAAWFMVVNWWWIDTAVEGMTEPLFMALLFGSFLAIRKERWVLAALLASGATVVRPVGIFALVAIGILLLRRRDFRLLAISVGIGLLTAVLYAIPMMLIYGDPLANIRGYRTHDWSTSFPVTIPLLPEIKGAPMSADRWKLQILIGAWVVVTVALLVKMAIDKRFWRYAKEYPAEAIFAIACAWFLLSYNAPYWSWRHFPRFVIPIVPFMLLVILDRLPRDTRIWWAVAMINASLAVVSKLPGFNALA